MVRREVVKISRAEVPGILDVIGIGMLGPCIIAHGSSKAKAIRNSIALAAESVRARMVETIRADIARLSSLQPVESLGEVPTGGMSSRIGEDAR